MSPLNKPRRSPAVMVVHGPEAFDHGDVAWLLDRIAPLRVIVAGVMARTAAEESGLDVEYDSRPPSRVIREIEGPVFLANRGKTAESGKVFGNIIASRLPGRGLVHAECSSGTVYTWDNGDALLAMGLAGLTGFSSEDRKSVPDPEDGTRLIRGCVPGEPVYVNGIVIGRALADVVAIQSDGKGIRPVSGLDPKPHGLEKLARAGTIDPATAWCKSGSVRSSAAKSGGLAPGQGRIVVIDHCGHTMYQKLGDDCCGVLAIGDDTTAVCGHICLHRGIPVLGITDQDYDTVLPSAFAPGSLIIDTRPERDDDVGVRVAAMVPEGPVLWHEWVQEVVSRLGDRATVTLDLRGEPR